MPKPPTGGREPADTDFYIPIGRYVKIRKSKSAFCRPAPTSAEEVEFLKNQYLSQREELAG